MKVGNLRKPSPWNSGRLRYPAEGPRALTVQAARFLSTCSGRWMSWFASVLRSQRGDDQPVRDSVGRAIPKEDAQRREVHRQ